VQIQLKDGAPVAITFNNVPSYSLGIQNLQVAGTGEVQAQLAYGGLNYAFVEARSIGIPSLKGAGRDALLDGGTRVWLAAREQTKVPSHVGPERIGELRPIDLITLWEPLEDQRGARVANSMRRKPPAARLRAPDSPHVLQLKPRRGDCMPAKVSSTKACSA